MRSWSEMFRASLLSLILASCAITSLAQQNPAASTSPTSVATTTPLREDTSANSKRPDGSSDDHYRIGPGDILEVRVARVPELSRDAVRVDLSGMIRMPMLNVDIPAACLTEVEVAQNVAKLYLKYKKDPHVDVFVKEYQSQPVAVIGAVHGASQFKLQRPVRLSELLSFAGGPTDSAGQTLQVIHAGGPSFCEKRSGALPEAETSGFVTYKLDETLHAVPQANPFVRPGDLVNVPNADQVYVVGNVLRPTAIPLKEPITISKAIAMAGGTAPATKKDKIRIIRQLPGRTTKEELYVDLGAIEKRKSDDILLLPNDIVDVPTSGTKSLLRSLMGAVVPAVSQLPVRVIP